MIPQDARVPEHVCFTFIMCTLRRHTSVYCGSEGCKMPCDLIGLVAAVHVCVLCHMQDSYEEGYADCLQR